MFQKTLGFRAQDLADLERQRAEQYWAAFNDELVRQLAAAQFRITVARQVSPLLARLNDTVVRADETLRSAIATATRSR